MPEPDFLAGLPVERRLALSYAPARSRPLWLGLLALDARFAAIVREAREPMLAQIKLAWWREELAKPVEQRRRGEPLLALLDAWGERAADLASLADTWEPLLGGEPLYREQAAMAAHGRSTACVALAELAQVSSVGVAEAASGWAMTDLAATLAETAEHDWRRIALSPEMRPLQVLYGLAARARGHGPLLSGPISALVAVRLGLLGI